MVLQVDSSVWLEVFGRFHIVLLHLPIGLIPAMAVLEFGAAIFRRNIPKGALLTLAVMTALTAAAAFGSGWVLAAEKVDSEVLGLHKKFAIAMASCCVLLPILAPRKSRRPFRLALAAALALSVPTGHFGGTLTHKKDFLFKPLTRALDQQQGQPTVEPGGQDPGGQDPGGQDPGGQGAGGQNAGGQHAGDQQPGTPPTASRYATEIQPIMERVCTQCHNPKDYEGDLDLTTRKMVLEGWGDEQIVIPGKPEESAMLESFALPLDDDAHMPPKDEEQLTKAEIETIRKWIADGCPE
jgi:hypothetical protein